MLSSENENVKDYLVEYYKGIVEYYGIYHNHKEISAWAGLGLHVLYCGATSAVQVPENSKILSVTIIALAVIFSAALVYSYIHAQLEMKDRGGAIAGAAGLILAEILKKDESQLKATDYLSIEESADKLAQSAHVLPIILLKKADILTTRGSGYQDTTKKITYSLLVLSTVSVLGLKCITLFG
jgi:hypothetical protein